MRALAQQTLALHAAATQPPSLTRASGRSYAQPSLGAAACLRHTVALCLTSSDNELVGTREW